MDIEPAKTELDAEVITKRIPMLKLAIDNTDGTSSGNWLLDLPVGAKFSVESKVDPKNFMLLDLELISKTNRSATLTELHTGQPLAGTGRVSATRFVNTFNKVETLTTYEDMINDVVVGGVPKE